MAISNHAIDRRSFMKGCIATGACLALAGLGRDASIAHADEKATGGIVSYYIANPTSIDPFDLEEFNGVAVAFQLFDALTYYDFDTESLVGLAAESWESNEAADEWTFKIKEGCTFHDGTKVTAASFKYGWERLCSPNTAPNPSVVSYHLGMVEGYREMLSGEAEELAGVTCPDEMTLHVKLSAPYADFAYVVSAPALAPIPECAKDDFQTYTLAPVGNGPFKMKGTWQDGQYIELERYDGYAGGDKPLIDGVYFAIYKDKDTAFLEFQAGNLDEVDVPNQLYTMAVETYGEAPDGYTAQPGEQVLNGGMLYTSYLGLNVTDEKLADVRVRQALSLALNRQAICDTIYRGMAVPAGDIVPVAIEGNDESRWTYNVYDPEKAKALLDEAGYPAGDDGMRDLELSIYVSTSSNTIEFQLYVADWEAVGIKVNIEQMEYARMLDAYVAGTFQIGSRGWYADYPIMDNFLYPLLYTGNGDNVSHYSNPEFDAKLDEARATVDKDARIKLMSEADAIAAEDMPIIPIIHKGLSKVTSARMRDFTVNAQMLPLLKKTWIEQ